VAAGFLGGRVHDRQRDPHRDCIFRATAGGSQRQRRTALQCRIQLYRQARTPIRLVSLARLVDCSPGQVIFEKGQQISEAVVVTAGDIEAVLGSNTVIAIRPGQLIGDVSAYSGLASPADVVARGPGALAKWDLRHVREFTLRIVSLATKLRDVATAGPSLAAEKLVPK
jgi:CRP-like cAMP-binding protein